jgi:hypothetical protein
MRSVELKRGEACECTQGRMGEREGTSRSLSKLFKQVDNKIYDIGYSFCTLSL